MKKRNVLCVVAIFFIAIILCGTNTSYGMDGTLAGANSRTISPAGSYGDFELVLPTDEYLYNGMDLGDGVVSDMNAVIYIKLDNTSMVNPVNYLVTIYDEDGMVVREEIMEFTYVWSSTLLPWDAEVTFPVHMLSLTELAPGTTITVSDIAISGTYVDEWESEISWTSASVGVYLTNLYDENGMDISKDIAVYGEVTNPILLSENGLRVMKYMKVDLDIGDLYYQTLTTESFEDEENHFAGGYIGYTYLGNLLNSINVFSYSDIEGTHIVGPIIAQGSAYYKRETPVSADKTTKKLIFADYSRGIASYIGDLTARVDGGRDSATNYIYDLDGDFDFVAPYLYTSTSTWLINNGNESWLQEYVIKKDETTDAVISSFLSPNDSGETAVKHNDDYFDFELYETEILKECISLITDGSIENFAMEFQEYDSRIDGSVLSVNPGECWNIVNADNLTQIDIILPDGAEYFKTSSPDPLTINFLCETINPIDIGGVSVSRFPLVTMNGVEFDSEGAGETIEYNEFGNKLIFNMPYIVTQEDGTNRVVTYATSQCIPGHLLMPQAEFWNYDENENGVLEWEGGNINGLLLASDVHVGETEMHMWAYGGLAEQFASYTLNIVKRVNGLIPQDIFEFELNPVAGNPEGIYTTSFPLIAESESDGSIQFQNIVFLEAGTYQFTVNEIIPSNMNMDYDLSEYLLTIEVKKITTGTGTNDYTFETIGTFQRIKDADGNDITWVEVDTIVFNNLDSTPVFPSTGGTGQMTYLLLGLSIMFCSLLFRKKLNSKCKHI